nr:hypothetical protein [Kiritimatiellia bacterium]
MSENLLYLLPGLSLQFAFAAGLLWLFIRPSDDVPVTHILLIALGFCILNLGIEWVLRDYLLEATLVAQWTFFVLLATHFLSIPLPRAALTMFCFFAFMLGAGMIGSKLAPPELSEEERLLIEGFQAVETPESIESKELSQWVVRVRNGILDKRLVSARSVTLRALYPAPETAEKTEPETDTETDMAVAEKPEPTPAPPKN